MGPHAWPPSHTSSAVREEGASGPVRSSFSALCGGRPPAAHPLTARSRQSFGFPRLWPFRPTLPRWAREGNRGGGDAGGSPISLDCARSTSASCTTLILARVHSHPSWGPRICKKKRKEEWDARCPAWKLVFWLL